MLDDPLRKEVAMVRKKIDLANRDLKPLGLNYQKKVYFAHWLKAEFTHEHFIPS